VLRDDVFRRDELKDVGFHLRALYADPRGLNLRTNLAHGLVHEGFLRADIAYVVVHSLLLLATFRIVNKPSESTP
jgi:lysyl-tRNA synthetase class 1